MVTCLLTLPKKSVAGEWDCEWAICAPDHQSSYGADLVGFLELRSTIGVVQWGRYEVLIHDHPAGSLSVLARTCQSRSISQFASERLRAEALKATLPTVGFICRS